MRPWLYRVAHNVALDVVARRRELPSATLPELASPHGGPTAGALVEALAALPERQRRVYVLREVHGLRIDETAAELGLAPQQVEQALFAARNRLAEHLVFGDRLDCVTVRRLSAGPLASDERRALKTHLRSCPDCRASAGMRTRVLSVFPVVSATWLRGLLAGMGPGSAPVAVKITAVAASAGLAVGLPASVELNDPGSKPLQLVVRQTKPAVTHVHKLVAHSKLTTRVRATVPARTVAAVQVVAQEQRPGRDDGGRVQDSPELTSPATATSRDGHGDGQHPATVSTPPPVTTTSTRSGPGDGSNDGGGSSSVPSGSDGHD